MAPVSRPTREAEPYSCELHPPQGAKAASLLITMFMGWAELPALPALHVFSYLDARDLVRVERVCHTWRDWSHKGALWKPLCSSMWGVDKACEDWKETYRLYHAEYNKYQTVYARAKKMFSCFESWLAHHVPHIQLRPGVSEQALDDVEKLLGWKLPLDVRCIYRLHDGQVFDARASGCFGGFEFYDWAQNHCFLPLANAANTFRHISDQVAKRGTVHKWTTKAFPFASSPPGWASLHFSFVLSDARVVRPTATWDSAWLVAPTMLSFMEEHVHKLLIGDVTVQGGHINLFPVKELPLAVTNGIHVSVGTLFAAEWSSANPSKLVRYVHAYTVNMSMPKDCLNARKCKLVTRHWEIENSGKTEIVDGPGVIGLFPEMYPGAQFSYQSCTHQKGRTGSMQGSFQMQYEDTGEVFDAVVPTFAFNTPYLYLDSTEMPK